MASDQFHTLTYVLYRIVSHVAVRLHVMFRAGKARIAATDLESFCMLYMLHQSGPRSVQRNLSY